MTHDFELDAILKEIVSNILDIFISLVLCIDSKSLYDCLVQLDTTQKKRFMIKNKAFTILKTLIDQNVINLNTSK